MNFTREPIVESIITPKDGCKLVIRNSKGGGQEEYFADAVEIISFGSAIFFRSLERPKCFLLPVFDYEVLEVRETRMVLKSGLLERGVKIGGGREAASKPVREHDRADTAREEEADVTMLPFPDTAEEGKEGEPRLDKKRERRRHRRKRGRDEAIISAPPIGDTYHEGEQADQELAQEDHEEFVRPHGPMPTLLPPPPTLISETLSRYREDEQFRRAFFQKPEAEETLETLGEEIPFVEVDADRPPFEESPQE